MDSPYQIEPNGTKSTTQKSLGPAFTRRVGVIIQGSEIDHVIDVAGGYSEDGLIGMAIRIGEVLSTTRLIIPLKRVIQ